MGPLTNALAFPTKVKKDIGDLFNKKDKEPVFITCKSCGRRALKKDWQNNYYVCPVCGKYKSLGAYYRLSLILDPGSFHELNADLKAMDPMGFPEYKDKLQRQKQSTGLEEAAVTAVGRIGGHKVTVIVLDSRFFMGSMSSVVGEKVTRAIEYANEKRLPLIIFSASGGARMQEGIYSLMQMAKTAAAIEEFNAQGGLYISYLTHPTTGGVTASFAS